MPGTGAGLRHRVVMGLEPSRGMATFLYTLAAAALIVMRERGFLFDGLPDSARSVATVWFDTVLGLSVLAALINFRRWRAYRAIVHISRDRRFGSLLPPVDIEPSPRSAPPQPPPTLQFLKRLPRSGTRIGRLRPVTPQANVLGWPPMKIVYLRVFENRVRNKNFVRGAWREFGYVYLLRSAASLRPSEVKHAHELLIKDEPGLLADLRQCPNTPLRPGWHAERTIAGQTVWTYDRYGAYPVRAPLCHGDVWTKALDILLHGADLVVLDLSGYRTKHRGTQFELQRIVDTVPVHKVILIADPLSRIPFLQEQVRYTWSRMADGSPNIGPRRQILGAVTDHFRIIQQQNGSSETTRRELRPSRVQSRWLLAYAQRRLAEPSLPLPTPPWGWHRPFAVAVAAAAMAIAFVYVSGAMSRSGGATWPPGPLATGIPGPGAGPTLVETAPTSPPPPDEKTSEPATDTPTPTHDPSWLPDIRVEPDESPVRCTADGCPTLTVTSTGDAPLKIGSIEVSGPGKDHFEVVDGHCSGTYPVGESCSIHIRFTPPPEGGEITATLAINQNLPGADPTYVQLSGTSPEAPKPNLAITGISCRWEGSGSVGKLHVRVSVSAGEADSLQNASVTVRGTREAGGGAQSQPVPTSGGTVELSFPLRRKEAPGQLLTIAVDPDETIEESTRSDNSTRIRVGKVSLLPSATVPCPAV